MAFKKLFVVLFAFAAAPVLYGCEVNLSLSDVTDYGTRTGRNAAELVHPFTFELAAPGSKLTMLYVYSSSLPFPGISRPCETPEACTVTHFCLRPGTYNVLAIAQCDSATSVRKTMQLVVPDTSLEVEIQKIEAVDAGRYDVHGVLTVPAGATVQSSWLEVFPLLSDGSYGEPRQVSSHLVDAATGDKVRTGILTCDRRVVRSAEAIVPPPPSIEVAVLDGDGQRAVIGEPAEQPLRVEFTASDPSWDLTKIPAVFEVLTVPEGAAGHGVGSTDEATGQTYSATVDADGVASATIVAGDTAGAYVVRVQSPQSVTGTAAVFTTTAVRPDKVAIVKDTADMADFADAYAVSSSEPTMFHAVGLDASGAKIGPMRCNWSVSAKGSPSSRGGGSVAPAREVRETKFTPSRPGKLTLSAASSLQGISAGTVDLFLTKLYLSVHNDFSVSAPVDDSPRFVPGMYLDGTNVALEVMKETGQFVSLHLLTGGAKGKATFSIESPTKYPGIAMNYPLEGAATTPDMMFKNGQQSTTVNFDAKTGDTWTLLLVQDFGASATIKVTVQSGKTTYALKPLKLPVDANGDGLPDAGWFSGQTFVSSAGLNAVDDTDNDGSPSTPFPGDGLSAYEEMRGIVQTGLYQRLDPRRRDLFVVMDASFFIIPESPFARLTTLPVFTHYLEESEVKGEDYTPRALTTTKPVVNPHRAGVPGARASGQRAVRVIRQDQLYPTVPRIVASTGDLVHVPAWRAGIFGMTILDVQNASAPENSPPPDGYHAQSPNETRSVEVFERTYVSVGIHTEFDFLFAGYHDADGNPTTPCLSANNPPGCDDFDLARKMIRPWPLGEGLWAELHTIPSYSDDYYTIPGQTCAAEGMMFVGGFSEEYIRWQRGALAAHEIGHAVHIDHNFSCGNMMSDRIGDTAPPPTAFIDLEKKQVRLWQ